MNEKSFCVTLKHKVVKILSVYKHNKYDITVECKKCHDMHDCEVQLFSQREVKLVREVVDKLFTRCHNCGANKQDLAISVSNEYFTAEEIKQRRKKNMK